MTEKRTNGREKSYETFPNVHSTYAWNIHSQRQPQPRQFENAGEQLNFASKFFDATVDDEQTYGYPGRDQKAIVVNDFMEGKQNYVRWESYLHGVVTYLAMGRSHVVHSRRVMYAFPL